MARTSTPRFTATRSTVVGPKHTTHTVTVRDADGNVTDTRKSKTMVYVEALLTPDGKINTCSQKVGGTPRTARPGSPVAAGWSTVAITSVMDTPAEEPVAEVTAPVATLKATTRKAKAAPVKVTAATIARDAGVDPYRFRVWLRSRVAKVDRTDIKAMRSAAKAFAREEMTRRVK